MLPWTWLSCRRFHAGCRKLICSKPNRDCATAEMQLVAKSKLTKHNSRGAVKFSSSCPTGGCLWNSAQGPQMRNGWSSTVLVPSSSTQSCFLGATVNFHSYILIFAHLKTYPRFALLHVFNIWMEMSFLGLVKYNRPLCYHGTTITTKRQLPTWF